MTKSTRWFALGVAAVAMVACSDSLVTSPVGPSASGPSFNVTGTNPLTITSGASTQYCSTHQQNGDTASAPATFGPFIDCSAAAVDLTAALLVYNPGWSVPFTGSSWIGFNTPSGPSSDYRPNPGRYVFQEVFTIPGTASSPVLDLDIKGDNVAAVYLNGKLIGAQANVDCNVAPCNWNIDTHVHDATSGDFHIGGNDTLTFRLLDLPTGYPVLTGPVGGAAPQFGCPTRPFQVDGTAGFTTTAVPTSPNHVITGGGAGTAMTNFGLANQAGCENPSGLDYAGTMSWTVATTTWCSPGFWKTHNSNPPWPVNAALVPYQNLLYNSFSALYAHDPKLFDAAHPAKYSKGGVDNPTLYQVISNPPAYGGDATNNVADILSNVVFGTPIGNGVESCPLN